jgi:transmembrane sensor
MTPTPQPPDPSGSLEAIASQWVARRDRGLSPQEQDAYLQWLRDDSRHGRAIAQLDDSWARLDALAEWRPRHAEQPNPDLLAPQQRWWRRSSWTLGVATLAAAAAIAAGVYVFQNRHGAAERKEIAHGGVKVLPRPERLVLADGSVVELNDGGRIQTAFTAGERRVRLLAGEALFAVAKNPARPFVVEAGAIAVRAVGTAFDVRRGGDEIEVLVTEGKVHLERPAATGTVPALTPLVAGQRAVIDVADPTRVPVISTVTPAGLQQALAWEAVRLEFSELPLTEVVAEFNLRNAQQLVIGDLETAKLRLGGTFRTDNVEGFVRLLEASFGVKPDFRDDGTIVLRSGH